MPEPIIAIDAMGGDHAPAAAVHGALAALKEKEGFSLCLLGKEEALLPLLKEKSFHKARLKVMPAAEVIETAEHPVTAIKRKKDSSMVRGFSLLKEDKASALISAGNSGALIAGGMLLVGRMPGVIRAPFAVLVPTLNGPSLLVDAGANVDAKPEWLVQYARLGSIYMREILKVKDPKVALINIGAEEEKGNKLVKEAMPLLKVCPGITFTGSVEARDIPKGDCDVMICDAFVGNVILKLYEGSLKAVLSLVKKALLSSPRAKAGALMIKPALKNVLSDYDISAYGGAPVLGLNKLVVKAHGSAKAEDFKMAVFQCVKFVKEDVNGKIRSALCRQDEE